MVGEKLSVCVCVCEIKRLGARQVWVGQRHVPADQATYTPEGRPQFPRSSRRFRFFCTDLQDLLSYKYNDEQRPFRDL